jgi:hypothetical protein
MTPVGHIRLTAKQGAASAPNFVERPPLADLGRNDVDPLITDRANQVVSARRHARHEPDAGAPGQRPQQVKCPEVAAGVQRPGQLAGDREERRCAQPTLASRSSQIA